jgi:hypothetical protein
MPSVLFFCFQPRLAPTTMTTILTFLKFQLRLVPTTTTTSSCWSVLDDSTTIMTAQIHPNAVRWVRYAFTAFGCVFGCVHSKLWRKTCSIWVCPQEEKTWDNDEHKENATTVRTDPARCLSCLSCTVFSVVHMGVSQNCGPRKRAECYSPLQCAYVVFHTFHTFLGVT